MPVKIEIKRTDSDNNDFKSLVALLDADLKFRDGDEHHFYAPFNKIDLLKEVLVAYLQKVPVGCGALKKMDEATAEVKRMFVKPEFRGKGIAQLVLAELEQWALETGYTHCVLETGKKQPEALRLYAKCGYQVIPNYGQYTNIENSVCMRKSLRLTNKPYHG